MSGVAELPRPVLCLVTDLDRAGGEEKLLACIATAVDDGVNVVQVRAHELSSPDLAKLAGRVVRLVRGRALISVNGDVDTAVSAGAGGAHASESAAIDPASAHKAGLLAGKSVHSVEAAVRAEAAGFDYVIAGTVFPSASHPGGHAGGPDLIRRISAQVALPVIGIGGITAANAAQVMDAGASGVAVIGAIIGSPDPARSSRRLAAAVRAGGTEH